MNGIKIYDAKEFNTVKEIIYNSADIYRDKIAFTIKIKIGKEVSYKDITYKDFLDDLNRYGTALFNKGFKNKRIAVIGKNRYEWAIAHIGNLLGGIVSVPLDKDLQYDELESSLIRSKADVIVFDSKLIEEMNKLKENGKTNLKEYICMDKQDGFTSVEEMIELGKELIEKGDTSYIDTEIDENAMNILLFTSGTTSKSKAVMLSQKNIACNCYALQSAEDLNSNDTNIAFLPFHHIFGSTCLIYVLSCGVRNTFPDGLRYIKQNLVEYKVSVFVGVPILIEAIYKNIMKEVQKQNKEKLVKFMMKVSNFLLKFKIDIRRKVFKSIIDALGGELREVVSGGAPADPVISKNFNNLGIKVVQGYGLTETSPVIAGENEKYIRAGSVGVPMVNDVIEIDSPDENGVGEIKVKGPNIMLGYYEMPEETAKVIKDGWFYTGDLGYIDKDGFIFITGRSKSMIVLKNGKKIFPEELETLVNRLDLVLESMVFGLPDENDKNDVKLSVKVVYDKEVVKEKYPDKSEDELYQIIWEQIKEINQSFPRYKHIQNMILTDEELIKTTTKKVKRQDEMKKILS